MFSQLHAFVPFTKKKITFGVYFGVLVPSEDKRFTLNQPPSSGSPVMNIYKIYTVAFQNKPVQLKVGRVVTIGARSTGSDRKQE